MIKVLFAFAVLLSFVGAAYPAAVVALPRPTLQSDPFVGDFENLDVKFAIRSSGDEKYEGTVTRDGQSDPFTAEKRGSTLYGKLHIQGSEYLFTATVSGGTLTVKSDGITHTLKRKGRAPSNPLTKQPSEKSEKNVAGWKLFKHPLGLSFGYPGDWELKKLEEGVYQLFPPGADRTNEVILIVGIPTEGITDPKDPRVLMGSDEFIASNISPLLKRKGGAEPGKDAHGRGVVMVYEGPGATGAPIQAKLHTTILKAYSVSMLALMKPEKIAERQADLTKIFATFRAGKAEIDPRLVGQWAYMTETIIDSASSGGRRPGDASLVGNHQRTAVLQSDGSMSLRTVSQSFASGSGVFIESKSDNTEKGGWAASEGKLILVWADGTASEYKFQLVDGGDRLILEGEGRRVEWKRG